MAALGVARRMGLEPKVPWQWIQHERDIKGTRRPCVLRVFDYYKHPRSGEIGIELGKVQAWVWDEVTR